MATSEELIHEFLQYQNLSAALDKLRTHDDLAGYDHSELNCLQCIGTMEHPNVTALAQRMQMTRGAISKIIQKLSDKGALASYQLPGNRQKVYYVLTDLGRSLFDRHEIRHRQWQEEELRFYDSQSAETLDTVTAFMRRLNSYLLHQLEEKRQ